MRGTRCRDSGAIRILWIIPADAGNTGHDHAGPDIRQDHPRGCGEHGVALHQIVVTLGSSPRMRGTQKKFADAKHEVGIIPADAGNTSICTCVPRTARDHPRGCGEHAVIRSCAFSILGSSPRMRGTLLRQFQHFD